jgi:hypothetical protein
MASSRTDSGQPDDSSGPRSCRLACRACSTTTSAAWTTKSSLIRPNTICRRTTSRNRFASRVQGWRRGKVCRTGCVPAWLLQLLAIPRRHPRARMQREPIHLRAQRPLHQRLPATIAADPTIALASAFAKRREPGQQLVTSSRVAIRHPIPDPTHQLLHVAVAQLPLRVKLRPTAARLPAVRTVQPQQVKVNVEPQPRIESLQGRHRARPRFARRSPTPRAPAHRAPPHTPPRHTRTTPQPDTAATAPTAAPAPQESPHRTAMPRCPPSGMRDTLRGRGAPAPVGVGIDRAAFHEPHGMRTRTIVVVPAITRPRRSTAPPGRSMRSR